MARDWRKVALAVFAAAALGAVCTLEAHAQATKPGAKSAKSPDAEAESDGAEETQAKEAKAPAKKKKQDPVEAQRVIEGATKLLQAGKADQAAQSLSAVLSGGNLPPGIMARALYARGIAHRQQGKPAQAISDLTSALWLKGGLPEAEPADALKQRVAAYRDAGLSESGEVVAATPAAGPAAKERTASSAKSTATTAQETAQGSQTGGNWFSNLFNPQPAAPPPPKASPQETASIQKAEPPAAAPPPRAPAAPRVGSAWASTTQVKEDREPPAARTVAAAPERYEGRFRVQLGAVRTPEEARALAAKAKREHGAALASREPEIDQAVLGNMGSFYRVRVGPFATAQETQAVCAKLKGSGFDCMAVTQ